MNGIAKLATEQGAAFLIGLAVIAIVQPMTPGGAVLLLLCGIATTNVIIQVAKLTLRRREAGEGQANIETKPPATKKSRTRKAKP